MTVNKLSLPAKQNAVQEKINEIIDNLGGGGSTDVRINGTSITNQGVADILTNSAYSSSNKIATMSDVPNTSNFVTTNTVQTITAAKNIYGVDAGASGQTNLLAVISDNTGTTGQWIGRMTVGAKNKTFIMGTYNNMCIIGAHSWTDAQAGTGAAWEDVYFNSDGNKTVYIGGSGNTSGSGWFKVDNSTGKVYVNKGSIASANFQEVQTTDTAVLHGASTAVGSSITPVYVASNGSVMQCTRSIPTVSYNSSTETLTIG